MEKTKKALKTLITGESEAVQKYKKFAEAACNEGFKNVGELFGALAQAETVHIRNHMQALGEDYVPDIGEEDVIDVTTENLRNALSGEISENKILYPQLIKSIKKECREIYGKVARLSMLWASKVEKAHAKLLKKALKSVEKGKDIEVNSIYICNVCGNIVFDADCKKECSVCGHDTIFFKRQKKGE